MKFKQHKEGKYTIREFDDGEKWWTCREMYHREDGPAKEYVNGMKEWYLNGNRYTEENWNKQPVVKYEMRKRKLKVLGI